MVNVRGGAEETGAVVKPGAHRLQRERVGAHRRVNRGDVLGGDVPADFPRERGGHLLVASSLRRVRRRRPRRVLAGPLPHAPGFAPVVPRVRAQRRAGFEQLVRQQPLVRNSTPGELRRSSPRLAPAAAAAPRAAAPREQAGRGASNASVGDVVVRARVRVLADDGAHGRDLNLGPAARRRALPVRGVHAAEETVATDRVAAESGGENIAGHRLPRLHRRDGRLEDDALASRDGSRRHHAPVSRFARRDARVAARAEVQGGEVLRASRRRERIVE